MCEPPNWSLFKRYLGLLAMTTRTKRARCSVCRGEKNDVAEEIHLGRPEDTKRDFNLIIMNETRSAVTATVYSLKLTLST